MVTCNEYRHTAAADSWTKLKRAIKKKAEWHLSLLLRLFLVPTAVGSYNDTRTHTQAHEPIGRSTVRGCHKGKSLKRGCCTVAAQPWTAAVVLQKQRQREVRSEKIAFGGVGWAWLTLACRKAIP